jgi:primosomal protein N' (replication factor Y)
MPRRAGKHRWQLVLTGASRYDIQQLLAAASQGLYTLKSARKTRWSIDVDPMDFH